MSKKPNAAKAKSTNAKSTNAKSTRAKSKRAKSTRAKSTRAKSTSAKSTKAPSPTSKAAAASARAPLKPPIRQPRVVVLYDDKLADVVTRHAEGHALTKAATALGDAEPLARALCERGFDAKARAASPDASTILRAVKGADAVVNLCDTLGGRGDLAVLVPALLEAEGIPYAGADAAGIALSKRKHDVKAVLSRDGLPTPRYQVMWADGVDEFRLLLEPPVIVKLSGEHASVGLEPASVCLDEAEVNARAQTLFARFHQPLVVEEFVDGREFSVSFAGRPAVAFDPMEHPFAEGALRVRTFDTKWQNTVVAARFASAPRRAPSVPVSFTIDSMVEACRRAFIACGCRDWGRVDVRLDRGGVPLIIDVTPNTYLGKSAPCVKAASVAGLTLADLAARIVDGALSSTHAPSASALHRPRGRSLPRLAGTDRGRG